MYPQNITFANLCWFACAPTLCYQLNYPRTPSVRWPYVAWLLLRMVLLTMLIVLSVQQYIVPTLQSTLVPAANKSSHFLLVRGGSVRVIFSSSSMYAILFFRP